MKKSISIQAWLRRYWLCLLLFCMIIYFLSQAFFLKSLTGKIEKNLQKSITIAQNYIEESLAIVDNFIYEAFSNSAALPGAQPFELLNHGSDALDISMAKTSITNMLQSLTAWSDMVDGIIFYTNRGIEPVMLDAGTEDNFGVRSEQRNGLSKLFEQPDSLHRYMIFQSGGQNHMARIMALENCYFLVYVSTDKVLQTLRTAAYDDKSITFAVDERGQVIFSSAPLDILVLPANEGQYISVSGLDYLQTGYVSETTGYYFGMLTDKHSITNEMWGFRLAFLALFLILFIFIPISVFVIHRFLERPLEKIVKAMGQVEEGDLDITVRVGSGISEFEQLVFAFNHMIRRIQALKIENYEVQLNAQKVTMQYLQLQIRPHFYANALNMIYSLAQTRDYEKIQRISVAIGSYSRYMFHDALELVALKKELEHIHDYMEMQKIRYGDQVRLIQHVPDELRDALIPPFTVQSFVENGVKYAFNTKGYCEIKILASLDTKKNKLSLTISDNGNGYSKELLSKDWKNKNAEGHIGLTNVYTRMRLIYEEDADIELCNESGAVAVLTIPYISIGNEDRPQIPEENNAQI